MQVINAIHDLAEHAVNFWPRHLSGHDDAEEVIRRIFHYLIEVTVVAYDLNGFDDVGVLERRAHAKFRSDFLVVFTFRLALFSLSELLYSVNHAAVLCLALDEPDSATGTRSKDFAPFPILL